MSLCEAQQLGQGSAHVSDVVASGCARLAAPQYCAFTLGRQQPPSNVWALDMEQSSRMTCILQLRILAAGGYAMVAESLPLPHALLFVQTAGCCADIMLPKYLRRCCFWCCCLQVASRVLQLKLLMPAADVARLLYQVGSGCLGYIARGGGGAKFQST